MTTGRINQVTIVNNHLAFNKEGRGNRSTPEGGRIYTLEGTASQEMTARFSKTPLVKAEAFLNHPIAPSEFPRAWSTTEPVGVAKRA